MRNLLLVAGLVSMSGCQWARVRYVDRRAQEAKVLVCEIEANDLKCREYTAANREDGVQVVPANNETRVDM